MKSRVDKFREALIQDDQDNFLPEHALLWAVIRTAILDLRARRWRNAKFNYIAKETSAWLLSDSLDPFSFLWIADHLDLNPKILRKRIFNAIIDKHRRVKISL